MGPFSIYSAWIFVYICFVCIDIYKHYITPRYMIVKCMCINKMNVPEYDAWQHPERKNQLFEFSCISRSLIVVSTLLASYTIRFFMIVYCVLSFWGLGGVFHFGSLSLLRSFVLCIMSAIRKGCECQINFMPVAFV